MDISNEQLAGMVATAAESYFGADREAFLEAAKRLRSKDSERLIVGVFYQQGDDPFICEINGRIHVEGLEEIERHLADAETHAGLFDQGDAVYRLSVTYEPAQIGDYGRIELDSYWDLAYVSHEPLAAIDSAMSKGGEA